MHRRRGLRAKLSGATVAPLLFRKWGAVTQVVQPRTAGAPVAAPQSMPTRAAAPRIGAPPMQQAMAGRADNRPAWLTAPGVAQAGVAANVAAFEQQQQQQQQHAQLAPASGSAPASSAGSEMDEAALLEAALAAPEETADEIAEREKRAANKPQRQRFNLDEPLAIPHDGYVCDRCNKPGHYKRDCPTIGNAAYDGGAHRKELHAAPGMPVIFMRQVTDADKADKESDARTIVNVSGGQATFITAARSDFLNAMGLDSDDEDVPLNNPKPLDINKLREPKSGPRTGGASSGGAAASSTAAGTVRVPEVKKIVVKTEGGGGGSRADSAASSSSGGASVKAEPDAKRMKKKSASSAANSKGMPVQKQRAGIPPRPMMGAHMGFARYVLTHTQWLSSPFPLFFF